MEEKESVVRKLIKRLADGPLIEYNGQCKGWGLRFKDKPFDPAEMFVVIALIEAILFTVVFL